MKTCILISALLGSVPMLALAADDANPVPLEMKYDASAREKPTVKRQDTCPIHIVRTQDERQNKETLGATFRGALMSGDAGLWMSEGLVQLKEFGFTVDEVNGEAAPSDGLTVKTAVTRAYTWHVGIKIFGMVAMKAKFYDKNGVLQEKYYRAHGDKTNMWGADPEYVTTLNYALNNLLPAMADDLVLLCKGTKVDSYSYAGPDPVGKK
jgi:hypothetical protein